MKPVQCVAITAVISCCCRLYAQASAAAVLHQADLQKLMRLQVNDVVGCTRLLNADGHIGCAADATEAVLAPLEPGQHLNQQAAVLLPASYLDTFLLQTKANATLKQLVKGVLVLPTELPGGVSPATRFPQAAFAPYNSPGFSWNNGTGLALDAYDFPILLLDNATAPAAVERAAYNAQKEYRGVLHHAHVETEMLAKDNSSTCINQRTCQPLGGHSVWGAAPPLPPQADSASHQLPLIMLLASIDSDAFFRSATVGAESAMGSLISLLAVADILGNNTAAVATYSKRLVLTALMGEPWGYMGSKRLLWDMYNHADTTTGLDVDNIEQVLDIGQVGKAGGSNGQNFSFFAHSQKEAAFGDATQMIRALQRAPGHAGLSNVDVAPAAASNPGIPPASLSSFLRVNPSIRGVVLADHGGPFINTYYQSRMDSVTNIQPASLAAAAVLAAQTVHDLAAGSSTPSLKVDKAAVKDTVNQLVACLLEARPGLQCALRQQLLGQHNTATVDHYISVLRTVTKKSQDPAPEVKSSTERFIWNFLALRLSQPTQGSTLASDPYKAPCQQQGMVCAGHVPGDQGLGHCVNATIKYVPSYSTHLECKDCDASSSFQWQQDSSAGGWEELYGWPPDPMWTESNWPPDQPSLQLFQKESSATARGTLAAGVVTALASLAAVVGLQAMFDRIAKHS